MRRAAARVHACFMTASGLISKNTARTSERQHPDPARNALSSGGSEAEPYAQTKHSRRLDRGHRPKRRTVNDVLFYFEIHVRQVEGIQRQRHEAPIAKRPSQLDPRVHGAG